MAVDVDFKESKAILLAVVEAMALPLRFRRGRSCTSLATTTANLEARSKYSKLAYVLGMLHATNLSLSKMLFESRSRNLQHARISMRTVKSQFGSNVPSDCILVLVLLHLQHDLHDLWEVTSNTQSNVIGYRQVRQLFHDLLVI